MSRCSQGMATAEVYKLNITRWTWELCEVGDIRKSSQLITRLYYNCPALKRLFFCKKSGHSCFYRVTCIVSQLLIWKLILLKNSHLCSRQWYLLHTFLKMTPLPYISEDQRDKFFTPLVRFQGLFSGVRQQAREVCISTNQSQGTEYICCSNREPEKYLMGRKLFSTYDSMSWQTIHWMLLFYSFLSHLTVTSTQVYIILILWSLGGDSEILWMRVVKSSVLPSILETKSYTCSIPPDWRQNGTVEMCIVSAIPPGAMKWMQ